MNCSDGKPCTFPCRKMIESAIRIADLPEGCPLRAPDPDAADKSILDPWRGRKLGARSVWGMADLAAGAFGAAEEEETLARFDTGGRLSRTAYEGLETYRENVQIWKESLHKRQSPAEEEKTQSDSEKKKKKNPDPPPVPTDMVYRLFMAAQNAAGKSDQLLDWIAEQKWVAGVPATLQRYLSDVYALPPPEPFDEGKMIIYELEALAGKEAKKRNAEAKRKKNRKDKE